VHDDAVVEPTVVENLPATQLSHAGLTPFVALYLPASQLVQVEALVPENLPAKQSRQVSTAVAPSVVENLPASQLSHARLTPFVALYLPAPQLSQAPAPAAAENLPAAQSEQVSTAVAP